MQNDTFNLSKGRDYTCYIKNLLISRMSYYLPTPHVMKKRRCLLNIQNKDDRSFLYCVVAAFKRPDRNAYRPGFYKPYVNKIITAGMY